MHIGHINLSESLNGPGSHFVELIESLRSHGMKQHVLVRNVALANRLDLIDDVIVGPTVRSSITAYGLMPEVDVVHIHDRSSQSAGLLLALTRGVPFVLPRHITLDKSFNPLNQAAFNRAAGFIEEDQTAIDDHIQIYRRAMDTLRVPTMIL